MGRRGVEPLQVEGSPVGADSRLIRTVAPKPASVASALTNPNTCGAAETSECQNNMPLGAEPTGVWTMRATCTMMFGI
jgi:hypothetical protein